LLGTWPCASYRQWGCWCWWRGGDFFSLLNDVLSLG